MATPTEITSLIEHYARHETGKIVSVLTRIFGSENMDLAEDVMQDSLVEALQHWQENGVPADPSAWLFRVAKNKALNALNRDTYQRKYASDVAHFLRSELTAEPALNHLFSEKEIQDDQLRMIFTCCHPAISPDSQVALALKTLCGFSIPEIARAFLTTEENINKRLVRARQSIRDARIPFEVPQGNEMESRMSAVLGTIYLLFNEGYSASKGEELIRYELCSEAIMLTQLLVADNNTRHKEIAHALLSLMFLNASRFHSRLDNDGNLLTMAEQDRTLWNRRMIDIGMNHLAASTQNDSISIYHVLAAISAQYCIAPDYESTDWKSILSLYDTLVQLDSSPLVLLNRAVIVSKVAGEDKALVELEKIKDIPAIKSYYLFYSTRAEFYMNLDDFPKAVASYEQALALATIPSEITLLQKKIDYCRKKPEKHVPF